MRNSSGKDVSLKKMAIYSIKILKSYQNIKKICYGYKNIFLTKN